MIQNSLVRESLRAFVVDSSGVLLSGTSLSDRVEIMSEGVSDCLEDLEEFFIGETVSSHEEEVNEYVNNKGERVFGAHAYVPAIGGCVIVEESSQTILNQTMFDYFRSFFGK